MTQRVIVSANYFNRKSAYPWLTQTEEGAPVIAHRRLTLKNCKVEEASRYFRNMGCSIVMIAEVESADDSVPWTELSAEVRDIQSSIDKLPVPEGHDSLTYRAEDNMFYVRNRHDERIDNVAHLQLREDGSAIVPIAEPASV